MATRPIRKLILYAHGQGHPTETFTIPPQMVIKYFGEFGKYCSIETKHPAKRICSSIDIVPRTAFPVNRAYLEGEEGTSAATPFTCNEEGCHYAAPSQNRLTRHIHARHVPRGTFNNLNALKHTMNTSSKNRGFIINPATNTGEYMVYSPRITEARSHAGNTVFPNLFIGTGEKDKGTYDYMKATLEECDETGTRMLINLETYIGKRGRARNGVRNPFPTMKPGAVLTLYDIVSSINFAFPGERIDLYIIACLDNIPQSSIKNVEESIEEVERPWSGLMHLGREATAAQYLRHRGTNHRRERSRSANRRRHGNTRRNNRANSRSAVRPHVKDE